MEIVLDVVRLASTVIWAAVGGYILYHLHDSRRKEKEGRDDMTKAASDWEARKKPPVEPIE